MEGKYTQPLGKIQKRHHAFQCHVNVVFLWLESYPNQSDICTQKRKWKQEK